MALNWPFMLLIVGGVLVVAIAIGATIGLVRTSRRVTGGGAQLARAERLRALPSFSRAVRTRRIALSGILVLGALAVLSGGLAAARPMTAQTIQPVSTNRDIMLCLDVSGSMSEVDLEIIDVFENLLDGFEGERLGLTIFNSSPVQVFPLTDDYDFIREHLQSLRRSFDYTDSVPEHYSGTLNGPGASLIGDGLTACAMRFDHVEEERSRTIIFASDNEVNGASIVSVPEAAAFAKSMGVRVFAINPVAGKDATMTQELADAAALTGGKAYELRDATTVDDIVTEVQQQAATQLKGQVQIIWSDSPNLALAVLAVLSIGFVALMWRVRL